MAPARCSGSADGVTMTAEVSSVEVHEMFHDDMDAANTWDKPDEVKPTVTTLNAKEWSSQATGWKVKKHAWTFFVIDGKVKV